jgi:cytochrome P450
MRASEQIQLQTKPSRPERPLPCDGAMSPEREEARKIEPIVDPDLVHFQPPERFPTGLSGFRTFLRSFIEAFPRSVYERGVTRIKQGFIDTLVICDPKLIQDVLVDRADIFRLDPVSRRTLATFTGETSLFVAEGAEWRWQRRAVAPTFRHEALLSFVPVFSEMAARQIVRWRATPQDAPIDIFPAVHETTFDVIVETMLGGASAVDADDYRRALAAIQDAAVPPPSRTCWICCWRPGMAKPAAA